MERVVVSVLPAHTCILEGGLFRSRKRVERAVGCVIGRTSDYLIVGCKQ